MVQSTDKTHHTQCVYHNMLDKFFVQKKGNMSCSHQKHPYVVVDFIKIMKKMGMDVPDIYAIKHDKLDKVKDNDNWTEFYAWAKTAIMKFIKSRSSPKFLILFWPSRQT